MYLCLDSGAVAIKVMVWKGSVTWKALMSSPRNKRGSSLRLAADIFRTSVTKNIASSLDSITLNLVSLCPSLLLNCLKTASVWRFAAFARGIYSYKSQAHAIARSLHRMHCADKCHRWRLLDTWHLCYGPIPRFCVHFADHRITRSRNFNAALY